MARKLWIEVPMIGRFEASSKTALMALIERERDYWRGKFPDGIECNFGERFGQFMISDDYVDLLELAESSAAEGLEGGLVSGPLMVMPPASSAIGRCFSLVAESGNRRAELAMAATMTVLANDAGVLSLRDLSSEKISESTRQSAAVFVAMAQIMTEYAPSDHIAEQEQIARNLLDKMAEDRADSGRNRATLLQFVTEEIERRQKETARFRKLRVAAYSAYKTAGDGLIEKWDTEFADTYDKYVNKLQFEAPVQLWKKFASAQRNRSNGALGLFIVTLVAMVYFCGWVVFKQGDTIAESFHRVVCTSVDPASCSDALSAKGPLSVGALLLTASLLLWLMKIFNRTYREAGQRANNADERRAFVETYEAMLLSAKVPEEHRAIVLSAIFRPSVDGAPVDDSSGLDISAVSMLAKALGNKA